MSCHSFVLIFEWAVQTCSTSYLLRSKSIATPFFQSVWWSSEPGSGVRQKNSRRSIGSSLLMIGIWGLMVYGVSGGKRRIYAGMVRMTGLLKGRIMFGWLGRLCWGFFAVDKL